MSIIDDFAIFEREHGHPLPPFPEKCPPKLSRVPTEADQLLAGTLSTIWPMNTRHPSDALHLAVFVNDELDAAMSAVASSGAASE